VVETSGGSTEEQREKRAGQQFRTGSPRPKNKERQILEEGLELVVVFRGKSYILSDAGDKWGIITEKHGRKKTRGKACR